VRDRPTGVGEAELKIVLAEGWQIHPVRLRYAPVGGGSYHWEVRDRQDRQWFVTVDDLDDKPWLGRTRTEVREGLRVAMDTAEALRDRAALQFVAAPVPAVSGQTVLPIGARYAAPELVITHGEPHPANIMRTGTAMMLIDWDTVGLAPPERDLWMVVTDSGGETRRYAEATGRSVDADALEFYRIRWALDDIAAFMRAFRDGHRQTPQTEHMWHWAKSYFD
jgi:hypothetical protein